MTYHKPLFRIFSILLALSLVSPLTMAQAEDGPDMLDRLLEQVKKGQAGDARHNRQRIAEFKEKRASQKEELLAITKEQHKQESISTQQEAQFETNEQTITQLQERLDERLGSLKELFGVLQQVASDTNAQFANSITQVHYPEREALLTAFAAKMGQTTKLPSITEIEQVWYEMQREMTASGKVVRFEYPVVTADGQEQRQAVIRIGNFNLIANGKYLQFIPETGRVMELVRQPSPRYLSKLKQLEESKGERVDVAIDPVRGQLLSLLVQAPNFGERIAQGGMIGYFIIVLGMVAMAVALFRLGFLFILASKMNWQVKHPDEPGPNPLGRVLSVYQANRQQAPETLELKLGEAVLRELPRINRGLSLLKIIAAVAPLMGLLGTVTGMIITFQTITLFGTGDPKLMAGGISQALVTTVLGLAVAIPTLLLHNLLQSRATQIKEILEQEGVAIVAAQAETFDEHKPPADS